MNHVAKRTITALVTASLVVAGLVYLPFEAVKPAMILLVALVHLEFSQMVSKRYDIMTKIGVASGLAWMVTLLYDQPAVRTSAASSVSSRCGRCVFSAVPEIPSRR